MPAMCHVSCGNRLIATRYTIDEQALSTMYSARFEYGL